jgi:S1-C subfamily serine protease
MAEWYWMKDGQKHGPVDTAHLKEMARAGQLQPTDTIWREGLPNWVPASQANGLEFGVNRSARGSTSVATAPPSPSSQAVSSRGTIKYRCVHCGGGLESEARFAGKQDTCPMCGKATPVPIHSTTGAGALFRKIPKAVYIGFAAVGLIAATFLTVWLVAHRGSGPDTQAEPLNSRRPRVAIAEPVSESPDHLASSSSAVKPEKEQPQVAPTAKPSQPEEAPSELFKRLAPSVVRVISHAADGKSGGQGSGFFISPDGLLVTNYHVIAEADEVEIFLDNNARFPLAGVMAVSKDEDIAVLKVDATNLPKLDLAKGGLPAIGTTVYAIGNPQGLVNTFSTGQISGLRKIGPAFSLIQCTAPISPGSSGGPLVTKSGEVAGMTTFYFVKGQNLNFAVPSRHIRALLEKPHELQTLAKATGRPTPEAKREPVDPPRWMKDLPYEARISFVVSARPEIRGVIEGYFKRELRKVSNVVLTDEKPRWQVSVVALPQEMGDRVVGYWMSVVVFEIRTHWDPKNPYLTSTSGAIVKHQLMMRGTSVLEEGVKETVAEIEGEIVEKDRELYEGLREVARKMKEEKKQD